MEALELEAVRLSAVLLAAEDWAAVYSDAPAQHADLIQSNAKLLVLLTKYYREMAKDAPNFINWDHYNYQVNLDYNVDVIVNDSQIDNWDDNFIQIAFSSINTIVGIGAQANEHINNIPLGVQSTDANIQALSLKQIASLVGKKVNPDGSIVDNPNAKYNVNDTVRADIAQAVKTSLALGENKEQAIKRIQKVIANPVRAERISNTESVNAYQSGLRQSAVDTNAVGKEWQDAGATDECAEYTALGPEPIDYEYDDGVTEPTAHPNCRCGIRYIYQEEWDALQGNS